MALGRDVTLGKVRAELSGEEPGARARLIGKGLEGEGGAKREELWG